MSQLKVNSIIPVAGVPSGGGGGIVQIKQTVKTDTFTSTSTSYTDVTGLTLNITPTSTSSKIMIVCHINGEGDSSTQGYFALARVISSSTDNTIYVGDSSSSRVRASLNMHINQNNECKNGTLMFLDSPNTTNEITYKIQTKTQGSGTIYVGRSSLFQDSANSATLPCSITAMEVSA
jgi:hypothetical protein|tara:strand:- start:314 stop:844 length:531 start_codon:yes stop_codon:yes gene_type:complete